MDARQRVTTARGYSGAHRRQRRWQHLRRLQSQQRHHSRVRNPRAPRHTRHHRSPRACRPHRARPLLYRALCLRLRPRSIEIPRVTAVPPPRQPQPRGPRCRSPRRHRLQALRRVISPKRGVASRHRPLPDPATWTTRSCSVKCTRCAAFSEAGMAGMTWSDKRLREPLKAQVLETAF